MPYHPSIPQATDNPTNSQADLLDNFGQINTAFNVNHIPFTGGGNSGYHTKIFFQAPLGADPDLTAPQSSLYPKTVAGATELFFQNDVGAANVYQLTNLVLTNVGTEWGFVSPWGLTFNMGFVASAGVTTSVTFQVPFAAATDPLTIMVTPKGTLQDRYSVNVPTNVGFNIISTGAATAFYYFAIGQS